MSRSSWTCFHYETFPSKREVCLLEYAAEHGSFRTSRQFNRVVARACARKSWLQLDSFDACVYRITPEGIQALQVRRQE